MGWLLVITLYIPTHWGFHPSAVEVSQFASQDQCEKAAKVVGVKFDPRSSRVECLEIK